MIGNRPADRFRAESGGKVCAEHVRRVCAVEPSEVAVNLAPCRLPIERRCYLDFPDTLHPHAARQIHLVADPLLPVLIRVIAAGCNRDAAQCVRRLQRQRLRIVRAIRHRDRHRSAVARADNRHGRGRERHAVLRAFAVHMQCAKRFPTDALRQRQRIAGKRCVLAAGHVLV